MQLLIHIVDAHLLKVVLLEVLEAEDVQQPDGLSVSLKLLSALSLWQDSHIHTLDQPVEHVVVESLRKRVPGIIALLFRVRLVNGLVHFCHTLLQQLLLQIFRLLEAKQFCNQDELVGVLDLAGFAARVVARAIELQLTHVEDCSSHPPNTQFLLGGEAQRVELLIELLVELNIINYGLVDISAGLQVVEVSVEVPPHAGRVLQP